MFAAKLNVELHNWLLLQSQDKQKLFTAKHVEFDEPALITLNQQTET